MKFLFSFVLFNLLAISSHATTLYSIKAPDGFNGVLMKVKTNADSTLLFSTPAFSYGTSYISLYADVTTAQGWCALAGKTLVGTPVYVTAPAGTASAITLLTTGSFYAFIKYPTRLIGSITCR